MIMSCYHLVMGTQSCWETVEDTLDYPHWGMTNLIIPLVLSLVCCEWLLEL